jgi:hypothetical protein
MRMITEIHSNYLGLKLLFYRCDCDHPMIYVKYKNIDPKTYLWHYEIQCSYCGAVHSKG